MFLAGADGQTPELRPPSVKGLMRFWWRAKNEHLSPEELKKEEGEIFGASDEKIGKSKFSIRVFSSNLKTLEFGRHKDKIELKYNLTAQYPFLKEIQLGKEYDSWEELVKKVGEASHEHDINSLGFAKGKKRLASPIYVSVLKNLNDKYLPIISSLNTVFEDGGRIDDKGQNEFKEAIL